MFCQGREYTARKPRQTSNNFLKMIETTFTSLNTVIRWLWNLPMLCDDGIDQCDQCDQRFERI